MIPHIGEGVGDQAFKIHVVSCHDQIFQVDGAIKSAVVILHKQCGDVVIFLRLCDQGTHRLLDGKAFADLYEVCSHLAADLVLLIGTDQLDVLLGLLVDELDQLFSGLLVNLLEHIDGVVCIHVLNDVRSAFQFQLSEIFSGIVQIGEDLRDTLISEGVIEDLPLACSQLVERV